MPKALSLTNWLDTQLLNEAHGQDVSATIMALCEAGRILSGIISKGAMAPAAAVSIATNADGDEQKELDIRANELIMEMLVGQSVAWLASEELEDIREITPGGSLAVTTDPLDGSSNVDTNLSVGTIFSIYDATTLGQNAVLQPGRKQLAAGYIIYGPQTDLVLTLGQGTHVFTLDRARRQYFMVEENVCIPEETTEFAINTSNFRHWDDSIRAYVGDCLDGEDGTRGVNFNMRWLASLVAECHRVFSRGGIFLYPPDQRPGYENGRLRLVYEANAIALLVEQAGGQASTGLVPVLDIQPLSVHERVPLIFGSAAEVTRVENYYLEPRGGSRHSPLFANRGLFVN